MSKFQEKYDTVESALKDMGVKVNTELLTAVCKGLGPALHNNDASTVASSDKDELDRLKKNFLQKKLGLSDSDDLDGAIEKVVETMGRSNPRKYRAAFYYLLTIHYKKESVYL